MFGIDFLIYKTYLQTFFFSPFVLFVSFLLIYFIKFTFLLCFCSQFHSLAMFKLIYKIYSVESKKIKFRKCWKIFVTNIYKHILLLYILKQDFPFSHRNFYPFEYSKVKNTAAFITTKWKWMDFAHLRKNYLLELFFSGFWWVLV